MTNYKLIVAHDKNRGIGYNLDIPWNIPEDQKRFKQLTVNQNVIMGSRTFQGVLNALGKPLPRRNNIILSRTLTNLDYPGCYLFSEPEQIIEKFPEGWIAGGTAIYEWFMPIAKEIYVTEVDGDYVCDTFFPQIPTDKWEISEKEEHSGFRYITYRRIIK